jgi:hypothetical protein
MRCKSVRKPCRLILPGINDVVYVVSENARAELEENADMLFYSTRNVNESGEETNACGVTMAYYVVKSGRTDVVRSGGYSLRKLKTSSV